MDYCLGSEWQILQDAPALSSRATYQLTLCSVIRQHHVSLAHAVPGTQMTPCNPHNYQQRMH